jgi:hypothetical protein
MTEYSVRVRFVKIKIPVFTPNEMLCTRFC